MKPLLPTADRLMPYLERIDSARHYCNFGPLNAEYQDRLEELFGAPAITASSATSALTATLLALALPSGSLVAVPSWTFVATPAAIVAAGHIPYFVDVYREGHISISQSMPVSAMVVVSPFGAGVDGVEWDRFSDISGIPVIIDAAAGFDAFSTACKPSKCPVVISTHATKAFGTGEGGFVTCHDRDMLERIRCITTFGMAPDRSVSLPGFNAKLSEYHAAVGLAELDGWDDKRERLRKKTRIYEVDYAVTSICVRNNDGRKGVYGCHKLEAYKSYPRTELTVTEELMKKTSVISISL